MNKYVITNTTTKEKQTVYSRDSREAKRSVCSCMGWSVMECAVRMVTD